MVAITYREGVILCEQYDNLNGAYFKDLIEGEFERMFRDANKGTSTLFVQDQRSQSEFSASTFRMARDRGPADVLAT